MVEFFFILAISAGFIVGSLGTVFTIVKFKKFSTPQLIIVSFLIGIFFIYSDGNSIKSLENFLNFSLKKPFCKNAKRFCLSIKKFSVV